MISSTGADPGADSDLRALFSPRSVAIVGASEHRDRLTGRPLRYLQEAGYPGRIFPVNPGRKTVQGLAAYPSLDALPEIPEVVLIVVPAAAAVRETQLCARLGVRGVYLLAGGFAETGAQGRELQEEIQRIARASNMRLLGPNCLGTFDARARFFGTFATSLERGLPEGGPVAIASQSGAYGQHLAYLARKRGLGVGHLITTGNELDVKLGECVEWLATQPDTRVILVYAECLRDGPRFLTALETARLAGKAVVVLKVGSSAAGAQAARSHTDAMAGEHAVHAAAYRQFGAHAATSTEEQIDIAYAFVRAGGAGERVGILSVSGGFGVHAADLCESAGLSVSALPESVQSEVDRLLPLGGGPNPVDITGQAVNEPALLQQATACVADRGAYDALLVHLTTTPLAAALETPMRAALSAATADYRREHPVVIVLVADEATVGAFEEAGFLCFEDMARAVHALGALARMRRAFAREPIRLDSSPPMHLELPASDFLGEFESKAVLRAAGLPVPHDVLATSAEEAARAALAAGTPVVMKIASQDIPHKTEVGGVLLDIRGEDAVRAAFGTLMERARCHAPSARIDGVLVTPMAPPGVETILGVTQDAAFGPVLMFGMGGTLAECLRDTTFRVAPIDRREAQAMIAETRASALLGGWRGAAPADTDALVEALVNLSRLAVEQRQRIHSVEVNPFRVLPRGSGALALDALVVRAKEGGPMQEPGP